VWYNILLALAIIGFAIAQSWYLRQFFKTKKIA